ncbi:uncharacterized protein LOC129256102 [Lytechinus pictus]|uniref:uncharacterized protein LOC129256102 n=1 Tax=Lytechinus pictus TaxID=7653 RepID=UPI0030B9DD92
MGSTNSKEENAPLARRDGTPGKRVNVVVCSCSVSNNVEGLISQIKDDMSDVVANVRFETLPYNIIDMDTFEFNGIDVLLLCHSIENRRFSLTNVTDALYDGFLPKARMHLGKSKIGVIAHDFPTYELTPDRIESRMESFRHAQETTFNHSSLVLIGGQFSHHPIELQRDQINKLKWFFHKAANPPMLESFRICLFRFCRCCFCSCRYG